MDNQTRRASVAAALMVPCLLAAASAQRPRASGPAPDHLTCEYMANPLGIDVTSPRFAWQSAATTRNWRQTAYEIVVATSAAKAAAGADDVWDSGKRTSDISVGIHYAGPALQSGRRYYWSVRVWDAADRPSPYAAPAWWEMGLAPARRLDGRVDQPARPRRGRRPRRHPVDLAREPGRVPRAAQDRDRASTDVHAGEAADERDAVLDVAR